MSHDEERTTVLSLLDVYAQVCTTTKDPPLIAISRHKDVMTAIRYLSSAYGTTPEKLAFTPDIEATYREQLRTYFDKHPKGRITVRNTLQYLTQLWKAFHTLNQTPQVQRQVPIVPGPKVAMKRLQKQSPYRHIRWTQQHGYTVPLEQWPGDISRHWDTFTSVRIHDIRPTTFEVYQKAFAYYLSYQLRSAADRIAALPDEAKAKLQAGKFSGVLQEIVTPSIVTSWDELFETARVNSYITWSSWRCWRWHDDILKEKEPHRPSRQGAKIAQALVQVAKHTGHPKHAELNRLFNKLQDPLKMHDKTAPRHRFELSELEAVALALIAEARQMRIDHRSRAKYPGMVQALRYQLGLILQLLWRNPMRARNWCEAILGHNLKKDHDQWRWKFLGNEMKIGMRGTDINIFEPDVPPDVAVHLDEFISSYRPHLRNADSNQHVFLSSHGTSLTRKGLLYQLKAHVNRHTGKYIYTHLLRSIFSTHHLSHGVDINTVAYAMNDTPASVLKAYNELMADTHRPIIADANRQALANGHKPLTPPVIPISPKPPKTDPDQISLI